jgi:hypothetical protein
MSKIYLSPYTSTLLADDQVGGCAKSFAPLHTALRKRDWPYDYGDDPSFFCRHNLHGALTWGVCRADVRSQVQPGDVVVFFSFMKIKEQVEYRLSAVAGVERKIRQSDIFKNPSYKKYNHYLNLLVRPTDGTGESWEHYEPGSPEQDWHKDWLSRIVPHKLFSKDELKREAAKDSVSLDSYIDGKQFRFGYNYVLFSDDPSQTLVLEHPPTVAHRQAAQGGVWGDGQLSREVFRRTIEEAQPDGVKRSLRLLAITRPDRRPYQSGRLGRLPSRLYIYKDCLSSTVLKTLHQDSI